MACGYPAGAGAVLIVELDGPAAEVRGELAAVERSAHADGAFEIRVAADDAERALDLEGAQVGVRRGRPDQPGLLSSRTASIPRTALPEVLREIARARRPRRACGSPTSSTPATATCTRSCSSTTRIAGAGRRAPRSVAGADPRSVPRPRRLDHRRARRRRGQVEVHDQDVQRGRPGHDAAAALRVRPGRPVQPGQGVPDAAAVRRGARRRRGPHPLVASGQAEQFSMADHSAGAPMAGDAVLRALAGACPAARAADAGDRVAGVQPPVRRLPGQRGRGQRADAGGRRAGAVRGGARQRQPAALGRPAPGAATWWSTRCCWTRWSSTWPATWWHGSRPGWGWAELGEMLTAAGQQLALDVAPGASGQAGSGPAGTGTIGGTLATGRRARGGCVMAHRATW